MDSKAPALVDAAKKWAKHYGPFPNGVEGAVLTATLRIRGAWERNDADIFADAFTVDGSLLDGDEQLSGREAIRSHMADAFTGKYQGSQIVDEPAEIFFLSPDAAVVVSTGGVLLAGETSLPPARENRTTWVVVKQQGEWKLFSYQSSPIKG